MKSTIVFARSCGVFLVTAFLGYLAFKITASSSKPTNHSLKSIAEFSYGPMKQGAHGSNIAFHRLIQLTQVKTNFAVNATRAMPLYIHSNYFENLTENALPIFFGNRANQVVLADLNHKEVLWSHQIPNGSKLEGTPLADLESRKFYFISVKPYKIPGKAFKSKRHFLNQIDFDGSSMRSTEIDLDIIANPNKNSSIEARSYCRQSLGMRSTKGKKVLFWGCGVRSNPSQPELKYFGGQNSRGLILFAPLDDSGNIPTLENIKLITSSLPIADSPLTGKEAGIWQLGSGPAQDENGNLYFGTGNGLFSPKDKSYACSILRVTPDRSVEWLFSHDHLQNNECLSFNFFDMSNSTLALGRHQKRLYSANIDKLGFLRVLTNLAAPQALSIAREKVSAPTFFGSPMLHTEENGQLNFFAIGKRHTDDFSTMRKEFVWSSRSKIPEQKVEKIRCIGFLSNSNKEQSIDQYFSGNARNDYISLPSSSSWTREITLFNSKLFPRYTAYDMNVHFFPPFRKVARLGGLWPQIGTSHKQLIWKKAWGFQVPEKLPYASIDFYEDFELESPNAHYYLQYKGNRAEDCENLKRSGWVPIYQVKLKPNTSAIKGFYLYHYKLEDEYHLKLQKRTEIPLDQDLVLSRSHPLLIYNSANRQPELVIFSVTENKNKSFLIALNARTGSIISKVPYEGTHYFSMPLAIGKYLVLSTKKHGLKVFSWN